jgi:hypothetical protein
MDKPTRMLKIKEFTSKSGLILMYFIYIVKFILRIILKYNKNFYDKAFDYNNKRRAWLFDYVKTTNIEVKF